ncbi:MAG: hypothetical protein ACTHKH_03515 [Trinickia sp.]
MEESKRAPSNRKARWFVLGVLIVACGYFTTKFWIAKAIPASLEPERISHYDSEAIPAWVRKDLPPITDPDGMRDTFFYPDGLGKGRVVHMRFPANYVSSIFGKIPPRHAESLVFFVVYPRLESIATPPIWDEMYKYGGHIPDDEMDIGIIHSSSSYLTDQAARYMRRIEEEKIKYPDIEFRAIPIPSGFLSSNCSGCRAQGLREIVVYHDAGIKMSSNSEITDTYIEWNDQNDVMRMMSCTHTDRPTCGIEISADKEHPLYRLTIGFHEKYLNRLREVVDRIEKSINSSVVEII